MPYQLIDTVTPDVGAKAGADKINNNAIQAQYQGGYFTVGGTANAITLTSATGAPSGYSTGQEFCFRANATNTGVTTVNVDGLGIKTIKTLSGADLPAGYLSTSVDTCLRYDGVNMVANVSTGALADQVPLNSNLGTAATKNTGTASGQVPTADELGVVGNTNYHSGNLNLYTFGGLSANDDIARGNSTSSTTAAFYLPISAYSAPSSITVNGTFSVVSPTATVSTGIGSISMAGSSNNKMVVITMGITGGTAGENLSLRTESSSSSIVVNF